MREHLFRAKRVDVDEWIEGDLVHNINCVKIREREADIKGVARSYEVHPETVCEYTGLTDKNGKKIFEGDIVQYEDGDGGYEYSDIVTNIGAVAYCGGGFYWTNANSYELQDCVYNDVLDCIVLGNKFDNSELLGENNE